MLTAEAIKSDGLQLLGWVANEVQPHYEKPGATLDYLNDNIHAPMLGNIPFIQDANPEKAASCLDLEKLFQHGRMT